MKILFALHSTAPVRSYYKERELTALFQGYEINFIGGHSKQGWVKDITTLAKKIDEHDVVIAVDNGILALALALEKPTIALFGGSDERCVVEQFEQYLSLDKVKVLRSPNNDECKRPCSFQIERGYGKNGKCGNHLENGDCMKEITPEQIFETFNLIKL